MDAQFWINAWNEGRTNFHQASFNRKLVEYFSLLGPREGQKVFVPLCGKTKDMVWLHGLKLQVLGIELHEKAVEEFFLENKLSFQKSHDKDFISFSHEALVIYCGDFFKFQDNESFDFVYDRAALVALPAQMREEYAKTVTQALKVGGQYLLIVYEYDQTKMDGPPFSVDMNEITRLYGERFTIKLMESERPGSEGPRLSAIETLQQKVYVLEKKS